MIFKSLRREHSGAASVEMALTLQILLTFIYGIFQLGVILAANAGMQHALGEGARYATIFPTPTNSQIATRITDKKFGVHVGTWGTPVVTDAVTPAAGYKGLSISYSVTPNFLLSNGPVISWTRTKRVYVSI